MNYKFGYVYPFRESRLHYTTFFNKDRPKECSYSKGKKRTKRTIETCEKCKDFQMSEKRYCCTLNRRFYFQTKYELLKPFEKCENYIEQIICYEANKRKENKC